MKNNFFYEELNNLANINAATDEADDEVILGSFGSKNDFISGSLEDSDDCLYGKLNKEVEKSVYTGVKTITANTIVDNANMTIAVDIDFKGLDSGFATDEQLQTSVKDLNTTIHNNYITLNSGLIAEQEARVAEDININSRIDAEIADRHQAITDLKNTIDSEIKVNIDILDNKINQEVVDRQQAITDLKTTIDNEVKTNLDELRTEINENIKVDIDELRTEINDNIKVEIEDIKEDLAEETANRHQQIEELENTINNEIKESLDTMQDKLDEEVANREQAITDLENTINNNILTKLDTTVLQESDITFDGDNVNLVNSYINLSSEEVTNDSTLITLANDNQAGMMSMADYRSLRNLESRVAGIEGKTTRLLYTEKQNPTAEDIQVFVDNLNSEEAEYSYPYEGLSIVVDETYHIWHFYENEIGWKDDGQDTVQQFTNELAGIILGSSIDGKVYAETDGTGSVYGWGELKTRVSVNETTIENNYNKLPRVYRLTEA